MFPRVLSASRRLEGVLSRKNNSKNSTVSSRRRAQTRADPQSEHHRVRKVVSISWNQLHQQLDQAMTVRYIAFLATLDQELTASLLLMHQRKGQMVQPYNYNVVRFMITAVKRLMDTRTLTILWYQQALSILGNSPKEREDLMRALAILAIRIPCEVLHLTGDLLPVLVQRNSVM
ncbi:C protein [Myotis bat morbillivirus]|uniref:Protein C n=1 Tax=Myotis bat morbillivirus TaxID=2853286 RepID=A0A8K1H184_9MONO|nr:C protein [Myotis bat morbillivirus]